MSGGSADIDERLWVTLARTGERGFIVGNCHTFPGRFSIWVPTDGRSRCVSWSEVKDASSEARYWIAGFLHGSVPAAPEDASQEEAWESRRQAFLSTGEWRDDGDA